jgi:hypothetical protein
MERRKFTREFKLEAGNTVSRVRALESKEYFRWEYSLTPAIASLR